MKIFATLVGIVCILSTQVGYGEEVSPDNSNAIHGEEKPKDSPLKESSRLALTIQFPSDSVESVLNIYDRLIEKEVVRDASLVDGPKIALVTPAEVSRDGAISLIEAALLVNGYLIEESIGGDVTVRFDASRRGEWILGSLDANPSSEPPPSPLKSSRRPSKESVEMFTSLSNEQRTQVREFVRKSMEEKPDMSREERGDLILSYMRKVAKTNETLEAPEESESPSSASSDAVSESTRDDE